MFSEEVFKTPKTLHAIEKQQQALKGCTLSVRMPAPNINS